MRPKILVSIFLLACLFLGLFLFIRKEGSLPNAKAEAVNEQSQENSSAKPTKPSKMAATGAAHAINNKSQSAERTASINETTAEAEHDAYVEKRSEELMELSMADDSESLNTILSELTNRDPQIRKAALEACIQFGSRDAIPKLSDAVLQTDDAKEKAAIVEAIDFLKLPSATELIAQDGGAKRARQKTAKR
jgi:hypothetical protein